MSSDSEVATQGGQRLSPTFIGGIMTIVAVISPLAITLVRYDWETNASVVAMTWQAIFSPWDSYFYIDLSGLLSLLPFTFLRLYFVIMMVRLYQGRTTKRRTLLVGLAGELQLATMYYSGMLFAMIMSPMGFNWFQFIIPIPILLPVGFLIIHFYHPVDKTMWIDKMESRDWWEEKQEEETKKPEPEEKKSKQPEEIGSPW